MLKPRTVLPLIPCRTPFKAWVWHFDLVFFFFFNNTKTCVLFASALCCLMQRIILRIIKKTIITKCGIFISNNQIAKVCLSEMRFEFWNNPQPLAQIHWRRFPIHHFLSNLCTHMLCLNCTTGYASFVYFTTSSLCHCAAVRLDKLLLFWFKTDISAKGCRKDLFSLVLYDLLHNQRSNM